MPSVLVWKAGVIRLNNSELAIFPLPPFTFYIKGDVVNEHTNVGYRSFRDFYPFYLSEHQNRTSRRLHFSGTALVLLIAVTALFSRNWWLLTALPVAGYGFAWAGHFIFEKNKPATFKYPFYSLLADFVMFWQILKGKIRF